MWTKFDRSSRPQKWSHILSQLALTHAASCCHSGKARPCHIHCFWLGCVAWCCHALCWLWPKCCKSASPWFTHRASSQRIIEGAGVVTVHSFKADVGNDPHLTSWWNGILSNSLERLSLVQTNMFGSLASRVSWQPAQPANQIQPLEPRC